MNLEKLLNNKTTHFFQTLFLYVAQTLNDYRKVAMSGGMNTWRGLCGMLAVILAISLITIALVAAVRGDINLTLKSVNVPQVIFVLVVVFTVLSAIIPASASAADFTVEAEVEQEVD